MGSPKLNGQKGQAIVLIAIMLVVVVGMAALAIDGARAYALRADMQASVDAAALAAADTLQQTGSYTTAEQAATSSFSNNSSLYTAPACSPGYAAPGAVPLTITCTYSDGSTLIQVVTALGAAGTVFTLTSTRKLPLNFARVLTNGTTPSISAFASSNVNNNLFTPALAALNQAGCGGAGGTAITVNGFGTTLRVTGDIVSSGAISIPAGSVRVAGDIYARCQSTVPGSVTSACYPSGAGAPCTFPDVVGVTRSGYHFVDPNYTPPAVTGGSQPSPGTTVTLRPGTYSVDPTFNTGVCWFLAAGVYSWQGGLTLDGDLVSNELKPPAEPSASNNTVKSPNQFWNDGSYDCDGDFAVNNVSAVSNAIRTGTWPVEVTSVRTDTYNGVTYRRESAPSMCQTEAVTANQVLQVQVSNVPGATSYNIYVGLPDTPCSGALGLAANLPVSGSVLNNNLKKCPSFTPGRCSLGTESMNLDSTLLGIAFAPNALAAPGVTGSYPPSGETSRLGGGVPNQSPDRGTPPAGDRANENQCDTTAAALATCPAPITPGAVEFYVPNGSCVNASDDGDTYVFSGYQYDWLVVYEPGAANPPANTCANVFDSNINTAWIGMTYVPSASADLPANSTFESTGMGGIIADTIVIEGTLPTITFDSDYAPVPPAAKLIS